VTLITSQGRFDYPFPLSYLNLYKELISTKEALIEEIRDMRTVKAQQILEENSHLK